MCRAWLDQSPAHDFPEDAPHERPVPGLHRSPRSASCSSRTSACRTPTSWSATPRARRWSTAPSLVGGTRPAGRVAARPARPARHRLDARPADEGATYKGLVFDATGLTTSAELERAARLLHPAAAQPRPLPAGGRASARRPSRSRARERVAQRALEGFTRSLGKEIGRGGTVQLVYVAEGAEAAVDQHPGLPALPQVGVRLRPGGPDRRPRHQEGGRRSPTGSRPLAGKVALVTGASRGIGEQIARVLHRDGATVVGVDVPQAASELQALMKELDGDRLTLDITGKDAPQRIAHHLQGEARRRRRRRAQRRHHPRQEARQHGRGPLGAR